MSKAARCRRPASVIFCAAMKRKLKITLVGAGSLASTLAPALHTAGYPIDEILSRPEPASRRRAQRLAREVGARAATVASSHLPADLVWLCVSDSAIAGCAAELSAVGEWEGKVVLHSSGALTSDELDPLRHRGACVASLHPMMSFVRRGRPALAGVSFAFEGDHEASQPARQIVRDLGGEHLELAKAAKPLYHALGAFGSPLLIMNLALAERVAQAAGIPARRASRILEPMVRRTLDNYFARGAAAAFSGPLVRGDVNTVRRHLEQLGQIPGAREVYAALARTALRTLPVAKSQEFRKLLK